MVHIVAPPQIGHAQNYSWDQFVEEYLQYVAELAEEVDDDVQRYDWLDELEDLHRQPLDINTATRDDLLRLHFLSDEQVDSLLARRDRYSGGFRSLGELMTVRQLCYRDRAWMSQLVQFSHLPLKHTENLAGESLVHAKNNSPEKDADKWYGGQHEVIGTMDIPLYRRAGFYDYSAADYASKMFLGQNFAHTLRYRYNWRQCVRYGATVQQDLGERFASYGSRPWDYESAYFYFKSNPERSCSERTFRKERRPLTFSRYEVVAGDYKLSLGQGLVMGSTNWNQQASLITGLRMETTRLRPNTGTDESRFLRGAAANFRIGRDGNWCLTAFASWRKVDGTVKGMSADNHYAPTVTDTITAWKTDGLHRTLQEVNKRGVSNQILLGGRAGYQNHFLNIGLNGVWLYNDKYYLPAPRAYNKYYRSGRSNAAFSADYTIKLSHWSVQGELAFSLPDKPTRHKGSYASTLAVRWSPSRALSLVLQERSMGKSFISPYGNTLMAGSQIQNEHGAMFGIRYVGIRRLELTGYFDWAYHPAPVYLADTTSHRLSAMAQVAFRSGRGWEHTLRYKISGREQNISGYHDVKNYKGPVLAWRTTQHLRLQSSWSGYRWSFAAGADCAYFFSQGKSVDKKGHISAGLSKGGLLYARSTGKVASWLKVSLFATGFVTDDYMARCYAYVPQLSGSTSFPTFYGKGVSGALVFESKVWRGLSAAVRYMGIKYFDRDEISSDINRISSSFKNDLFLQLRWKF